MAIVTKQIGFTIDIDEDAIAPASVNVFIYQLINRLGYEHAITDITIDGTTKDIANNSELKSLPLGRNQNLEDKK